MGKRGKKTLEDTLGLISPGYELVFRDYYNFYFKRLTEIAITMFKWEGFPDTVDTRFLEYVLFTDGGAVIFDDEVLGRLGLQVAYGGTLDVYRYPTKRTAFAANGYYNSDLNENNSVIIFNDYLRSGMINGVRIYAQRLARVEQTINVNLTGQQQPITIVAPQSMQLTVQQAYNDYKEGSPVLAFFPDALNNMGQLPLQVFKTDAPYNIDKLYQFRSDTWNDALTYLGVSNLQINKKERMLRDEVLRNMGGIEAQKYTRLAAREQGAKKYQEIFGEEITVQYREDIPASLTQLEGGADFGNVYNTSPEYM